MESESCDDQVPQTHKAKRFLDLALMFQRTPNEIQFI